MTNSLWFREPSCSYIDSWTAYTYRFVQFHPHSCCVRRVSQASVVVSGLSVYAPRALHPIFYCQYIAVGCISCSRCFMVILSYHVYHQYRHRLPAIWEIPAFERDIFSLQTFRGKVRQVGKGLLRSWHSLTRRVRRFVLYMRTAWLCRWLRPFGLSHFELTVLGWGLVGTASRVQPCPHIAGSV